MTVLSILLATLAAGIGSVWLAAALMGLGVRGPRAVDGRQDAQNLLSLAAGALLATAFMHLLPEAFESGAGAKPLFATLLVSLVFFFLLDKAELWHHGHEHHQESAQVDQHARPGHSHAHHPPHDHAHADPAGPGGGWAVLAGDSVHCFGDGVLIASAFVADARLGLVAAVAVLAHEVPHHIGDLAVLSQSSGSRRAAILKVSLAGAVTPLGGLVGLALVGQLHALLPFLLVVAGSSFIYVALADLIPQLQKRAGARETAGQVFWLAIGILLVATIGQLVQIH
ncbi:MAG: ZIP family metal transporter [Ramlibacter sp.]